MKQSMLPSASLTRSEHCVFTHSPLMFSGQQILKVGDLCQP